MSTRVHTNRIIRANRTGGLRGGERHARRQPSYWSFGHGHLRHHDGEPHYAAIGAAHRHLQCHLPVGRQLGAVRAHPGGTERRERRQLLFRQRFRHAGAGDGQLVAAERSEHRLHQPCFIGAGRRHRRQQRIQVDQDHGRPGPEPVGRARGRADADIPMGLARRRPLARQVRVRPSGCLLHRGQSRQRAVGFGHLPAAAAAGAASVYAHGCADRRGHHRQIPRCGLEPGTRVPELCQLLEPGDAGERWQVGHRGRHA